MNQLKQDYKDFIESQWGSEYSSLLPEYLQNLVKKNAKIIEKDYGFITYGFNGDAVILYDLYIKPRCRNQHKALELFTELMVMARQAGKSVVITMSQKSSKIKHLGLVAIQSVGFKKFGETEHELLYIRGV